MRVQTRRRRAAAVGFPGRHTGGPGIRRLPGVSRTRLERRAAHRHPAGAGGAGNGSAVGGPARGGRGGRGGSAGGSVCRRSRSTRIHLRSDRLRLRRRRGDTGPRRRSATAPDGGVRRHREQRRPQGWTHSRRSGRPGVRRRPRSVATRSRQVAHRAVGMGRGADRRRDDGRCRSALRPTRRGAGHPDPRAHHRRRARRPA